MQLLRNIDSLQPILQRIPAGENLRRNQDHTGIASASVNDRRGVRHAEGEAVLPSLSPQLKLTKVPSRKQKRQNLNHNQSVSASDNDACGVRHEQEEVLLPFVPPRLKLSSMQARKQKLHKVPKQKFPVYPPWIDYESNKEWGKRLKPPPVEVAASRALLPRVALTSLDSEAQFHAAPSRTAKSPKAGRKPVAKSSIENEASLKVKVSKTQKPGPKVPTVRELSAQYYRRKKLLAETDRKTEAERKKAEAERKKKESKYREVSNGAVPKQSAPSKKSGNTAKKSESVEEDPEGNIGKVTTSALQGQRDEAEAWQYRINLMQQYASNAHQVEKHDVDDIVEVRFESVVNMTDGVDLAPSPPGLAHRPREVESETPTAPAVAYPELIAMAPVKSLSVFKNRKAARARTEADMLKPEHRQQDSSAICGNTGQGEKDYNEAVEEEGQGGRREETSETNSNDKTKLKKRLSMRMKVRMRNRKRVRIGLTPRSTFSHEAEETSGLAEVEDVLDLEESLCQLCAPIPELVPLPTFEHSLAQQASPPIGWQVPEGWTSQKGSFIRLWDSSGGWNVPEQKSIAQVPARSQGGCSVRVWDWRKGWV